MAGWRDSGHTDAIMNDLFLPSLHLALAGETGTLVLALFLSALTATFTYRMENRRQK